MTTGIQCRADPRCEEPAPPETGICHCHAKQATKADPTIHRLSWADQVRRPWSPRAGDGAGAMTGIAARISGWVGRRQRDLSDRVHAAGDAVARQHGWTVTATTGRFGFGARIYRDPRFDDRRLQLSLRGQAAAVPPARRRSGRPKIRRARD